MADKKRSAQMDTLKKVLRYIARYRPAGGAEPAAGGAVGGADAVRAHRSWATPSTSSSSAGRVDFAQILRCLVADRSWSCAVTAVWRSGLMNIINNTHHLPGRARHPQAGLPQTRDPAAEVLSGQPPHGRDRQPRHRRRGPVRRRPAAGLYAAVHGRRHHPGHADLHVRDERCASRWWWCCSRRCRSSWRGFIARQHLQHVPAAVARPAADQTALIDEMIGGAEGGAGLRHEEAAQRDFDEINERLRQMLPAGNVLLLHHQPGHALRQQPWSTRAWAWRARLSR